MLQHHLAAKQANRQTHKCNTFIIRSPTPPPRQATAAAVVASLVEVAAAAGRRACGTGIAICCSGEKTVSVINGWDWDSCGTTACLEDGIYQAPFELHLCNGVRGKRPRFSRQR